jgi:hypothetical protein
MDVEFKAVRLGNSQTLSDQKREIKKEKRIGFRSKNSNDLEEYLTRSE